MSSRTMAMMGVALAGLLGAAQSAAAGDPIPVCIAGDGTMRTVELQASCPDGQEKKLLAEWEPDVPDLDEDEETKEKSLEARIIELSGRLAMLEARAGIKAADGVTKVSAPFEVVGSDGVTILRVATDGASPHGARVTIGGGSAGNYALRVFKGTQLLSGIGQAVSGGGLVVAMDNGGQVAVNIDGQDRRVAVFKEGHMAAGIVAEAHGGTVAVYGPDGPAVAYLTTSSAGDGGNVTVSLNSGFGVFSAGAAQDGGGEACVSRITQAGTPRLACVGLGLPSAGMGK